MDSKKVTRVKKRFFIILSEQLTHRLMLLFLIDFASIFISFYLASVLKTDTFELSINVETVSVSFSIYLGLVLSVQYLLGLYKSIWKYASINELAKVVISALVSGGLLVGYTSLINIPVSYSYVAIYTLMLMVTFGGVRLGYRVLRRQKRQALKNEDQKRVLIVGGGDGGYLLIKELYSKPELGKYPVGIIDDSPQKLGRQIQGVSVIGGRQDIVRICENREIDEIIIAIPSISKAELKELLGICKQTKCHIKTLPGVYQIIDGKVDIKQIRDVEIEDLLGRDPIQVDMSEITHCIKDKVVLVTGGGGSIGSELCRQIVKFKPKTLVIIDIYENNAYDIQMELKRKYGSDLDLQVIIASIRDDKRMNQIFEKYKPQLVYHAAAHKHVPLMEDSPQEAVKNNVFGTYNVVRCADKYCVEKFVLVSTDKAVNPTNIMGATKRLAEMIIQAMNTTSQTEYVAVRFGNVLGSNGSVIPLFKKQIKKGGPVTITHPDIIRYFMTIPEAVQLVLQAGSMAAGGEIFVLDMGDPVKIVDLANDLITLSGFEPGVDIKLEFTGLRPGEKLYEELLMAEEGLLKTANKKIFIGQATFEDMEKLNKNLTKLYDSLATPHQVKDTMKKIVKTYVNPDEINKKVAN